MIVQVENIIRSTWRGFADRYWQKVLTTDGRILFIEGQAAVVKGELLNIKEISDKETKTWQAFHREDFRYGEIVRLEE